MWCGMCICTISLYVEVTDCIPGYAPVTELELRVSDPVNLVGSHTALWLSKTEPFEISHFKKPDKSMEQSELERMEKGGRCIAHGQKG